MGKPPVYTPRLPPSRASMRPTASVTDMAERMAADRRKRSVARDLEDQRKQDQDPTGNLLTVAAVLGGLNDLSPADPSPSDFSGGGGDFGGAGASGDF